MNRIICWLLGHLEPVYDQKTDKLLCSRCFKEYIEIFISSLGRKRKNIIKIIKETR